LVIGGLLTRIHTTALVIPAGNAGIHDCTDAGGRATQEQLPRSHGWRNQRVHLLPRQSVIGVARRLKRLLLVIGGLPRAESVLQLCRMIQSEFFLSCGMFFKPLLQRVIHPLLPAVAGGAECVQHNGSASLK